MSFWHADFFFLFLKPSIYYRKIIKPIYSELLDLIMGFKSISFKSFYWRYKISFILTMKWFVWYDIKDIFIWEYFRLLYIITNWNSLAYIYTKSNSLQWFVKGLELSPLHWRPHKRTCKIFFFSEWHFSGNVNVLWMIRYLIIILT